MKLKKVKLPHRNGTEHPFIKGIHLLMKKHECSRRVVAIKHLHVTQQTLNEWYQNAEEKRDWLAPPRRVLQICKLTGQRPHDYNPAIFPKGRKP